MIENNANNTAKRRGLGRGLGALLNRDEDEAVFSSAPAVAEAGEGVATVAPFAANPTAAATTLRTGVQMIALDKISPNPRQPRTTFDQQMLAELAASIQEHGILQPLIVTANLDELGQYWLVAGERRWRAARLAGLNEVQAIVREASSQQLVEWALIENVQRADLNPLEEAAAYQSLMADFGLTQADVAKRVGRSRSAVANTVRLLQLPLSVQKVLSENQISEGHARALLGLPDEATIEQLLAFVLEKNLSVRQTELTVQQWLAARERPAETTKAAQAPPDRAEITHLENRFRSVLGTRVSLNRNADGSGKLVVHFFNNDDLDAIYQLIVEKR